MGLLQPLKRKEKMLQEWFKKGENFFWHYATSEKPIPYKKGIGAEGLIDFAWRHGYNSAREYYFHCWKRAHASYARPR